MLVQRLYNIIAIMTKKWNYLTHSIIFSQELVILLCYAFFSYLR